jgi:hypothetical protein
MVMQLFGGLIFMCRLFILVSLTVVSTFALASDSNSDFPRCGTVYYEPFGLTQQAWGKGHAGMFFEGVCSHDGLSVVTQCTSEEKNEGIVIARFPTVVAGQKNVFVAAPKNVAFFGVENSEDNPMIAISDLSSCLQESYWNRHWRDSMVAPNIENANTKKLEEKVNSAEKSLNDSYDKAYDENGVLKSKATTTISKREVVYQKAVNDLEKNGLYKTSKFLKTASGDAVRLPLGSWRSLVGSAMKQDISMMLAKGTNVKGEPMCIPENLATMLSREKNSTENPDFGQYGQFFNNCGRFVETEFQTSINSNIKKPLRKTNWFSRFYCSVADLGFETPETPERKFSKFCEQNPDFECDMAQIHQLAGDRWKSSPAKTLLEAPFAGSEQVTKIKLIKLYTGTLVPPLYSLGIHLNGKFGPHFRDDTYLHRHDAELGKLSEKIQDLRTKIKVEKNENERDALKTELSVRTLQFNSGLVQHWGTNSCWGSARKAFGDLVSLAGAQEILSAQEIKILANNGKQNEFLSQINPFFPDKRKAYAHLLHQKLIVELDRSIGGVETQCQLHDKTTPFLRVPTSRKELIASLLDSSDYANPMFEDLSKYEGVKFDVSMGFKVLINALYNDLVVSKNDRRSTDKYDQDWFLALEVAKKVGLSEQEIKKLEASFPGVSECSGN